MLTNELCRLVDGEYAAHAQGQALLKIAPVVVTHVQQLIVDHPGIGRDAAVLRCEPVAVVEEMGSMMSTVDVRLI